MRLNKFKSSPDNDLRKLPPSRASLLQHVKRACYQSGYLWRESLENFDLPDAQLWGWVLGSDGFYVPHWMSETSSVDMEEFIATCKCYSQKCKTCKCSRTKIKCIFDVWVCKEMSMLTVIYF